MTSGYRVNGSFMNPPADVDERGELRDAAIRPRAVAFFCSFAFLFFSGAFSHVFESSDAPLRSLYIPLALCIHLTALLLLFANKRRQTAVVTMLRNGSLLIALGVIVASVMWSIDPMLSARRVIALLGTTAVAMLIYIEYEESSITKFFTYNLGFLIIGSVCAAVLLPGIGTHAGDKFEGQWRGLLTFKNQAAWVAAIYLTLLISRGQFDRLNMADRAIGILAVIFLIKTGSATGVAATISGLSFLAIIRLCARSVYWRIIFGYFLVFAIVFSPFFFLGAFDLALEALGRDSTLTGRTSIWLALLPIIEQNLVLGVGYLAFWDQAEAYFGAASWMVDIGHAHNAYVEIMLDVGLLGFATQIYFVLTLVARAYRRGCNGDSQSTAAFSILSTFMIIGIAGALFFRANSGIWIITVCYACHVNAQNTHRARSPFIPDSTLPVVGSK